MATYRCSKCNMAVDTTCTDCQEPLVDATLTKDDGSTVQIAQCPKCAGKIKSPMCCGQDMACAV